MYLGGTVESCKNYFGHIEMAGKENGSSLRISVGPGTSCPKHPLCILIHDPMISVS